MAVVRKNLLKKIFKITLVAAGVLVILFFAAQMWLEHNAKRKLEKLVYERSDGKMILNAGKVKVNLFQNYFEAQNSHLADVDTTTDPITYQVDVKKVTVTVQSIWPLLFGNLLLDSIKVYEPTIRVTQWRIDSTDTVSKNLSISQQMGRMYNNILTALQDYAINRISINDAAFSFIDKTQPQQRPAVIDKVYFDLIRTNPAANEQGEYVKGEQSVELRTKDQHIYFPGNRHQLAFSSFRLQLFHKRVVIDSCTIIARETDSSANSYSIFSKQIILSGIDFDAMYEQNILRADSAYFADPVVRLQFQPPDSYQNNNKPQSPEQAISALAGKMDIGFIGVKNAGIHIRLTGNEPRSIFNNNSDDITIFGLRINVDKEKPLTVDKLDMAMRNYRMFNEDSSSSYGFRTLALEGQQLTLSNFFVETSRDRAQKRNLKNITIPEFKLKGVNWSRLAFDQSLQAEEATLTNPSILYKKVSPPRKRKRSSIFTSLHTIDELINLQRLKIIHGQVDVQTNPSTSFAFKDIDLDISTNRLLVATNTRNLVRAVNKLAFTYGSLRLRDVTTRMYDVSYGGRNIINVHRAVMTSNSGDVGGEINNVSLENLRFIENEEKIAAERFHWSDASVSVKSAVGSSGGPNNKSLKFDIHNIHGGQTKLSIDDNGTSVLSSVKQVDIGSLQKNNAGFYTHDVQVKGSKIDVNGKPVNATTDIDMLAINNLVVDADKVNADNIQWNNASLILQVDTAFTTSPGNSGKTLELTGIVGGNTSVQYSKGNTSASTFLTQVTASSVTKNEDGIILSGDVKVNGRDFSAKQNDIAATTGSFQLHNRASSFINDLNVDYKKPADTLLSTVDKISFQADFNDILNEKYQLASFIVERPVVDYKKWKNRIMASPGNDSSSENIIDFDVANLEVIQPSVNVAIHQNDSSVLFSLPASANANIHLRGLSSKDNQVNLHSASALASSIFFKTVKNDTLSVQQGTLQADLANIQYSLQKDSIWRGDINELVLVNPKPLVLKGSGKLQVDSLVAKGIHISSENADKPGKLIANNINAIIRTSGLRFADSMISLQSGRIHFTDRLLSIDTFQYHPSIPRDEYIAGHEFETDAIDVWTGPIFLKGLSVDSIAKGYMVSGETLVINNATANIFRDKKPPLSGKYKPLPTGMIRSIPLPVSLKNITLHNANISYTEKHAITRAEGLVFFTGLEGMIGNITNHNISRSDSLHIWATAKLMDTAQATLNVLQSYADSLNAFVMNFTVKPMPLKVLNPVFAPTANVKIASGRVDSVSVRAIGREYLSLGEMDMFYKNLSIKLVKNGDVNNTPFLYDAASFLINTFLVKNKNRNKTNLVHFVRLRDRSFFNYLFKITFSGMQTSTGVKSNHKLYKNYKEEVLKRGLPPIEFYSK